MTDGVHDSRAFQRESRLPYLTTPLNRWAWTMWDWISLSRLVALSWLACLAFAAGARAAEPVDVALVLVTDVSRSIDDSEFALEKTGYAAALTDRDVIQAIKGGAAGAIAVNYVEFSDFFEVNTVLDWTVIYDEATAKAFVSRLIAAPRSASGRTSISAGLQLAMKNLASAGLEAQRRVIDVCGDGTNNAGEEVRVVRDQAVAQDITINGLAIINEHPVSWHFAHVQPPGGLGKYYRDNVAGGPAAFVMEVHDFHIFGAAMKQKLITEIAGREAPDRPSRVATLPAPSVKLGRRS